MTQRSNPSAPALASRLRPSVMRLSRRLRQMRDSSVDLSPNQLSALGVLLNHGDKSMGELATAEQVRPPSMTRIINDLVEQGYVARLAHPVDGRQCVVTITEIGHAALLANRRRRDEWLATRLADLDPAERAVLAHACDILDRINHS